MVSFREFSNKLWPANWSKWIWIGLAVVSALRFYYVQEMIAALIIFSILFVAMAIALLVIFLLDRIGQQVLIWTEVGVIRLWHWVVDAIEGIRGDFPLRLRL
jgi:hypothetical protein